MYFRSLFRQLPCILAFAGSLIADQASAQMVLNQTQSPNTLVESILIGQGILPSNVTFNGGGGDVVANTGLGYGEIGRFNGSQTNVGLNGGVFLCTNVALHHIPGPNTELMESGGGIGAPIGLATPDRDLSQLSGWAAWEISTNTYNRSVLEFDFVPVNDMVSFRYVFSSEEYERWACSEFNDTFGWFISGPGISGPFDGNAMNIAFVPGSLDPVCINSVNSGSMDDNNANGPDWTNPYDPCLAYANWQANAQYYRYNGGQWPMAHPFGGVAQGEAPYNNDPAYIQHNGLTVVLTASAAVQIGQTYHMKMGIANVRDGKYPSAVFIEGGSFRSTDRFSLTVDAGDNVDLTGPTPVLYRNVTGEVTLRINRWGGFYLDEDVQLTVAGNAVAGVDYQPELPTSIHLDQLDSSATFTLTLPPGAGEPRELIVNLVTGNGDKMQGFPLIITDGNSTDVGEQRRPAAELTVFPQPASQNVQVRLPAEMTGGGELLVLDMARRAVRTQRITSTTAILAVDDLPQGLYTVRATVGGHSAVARVCVVH
ncbi:MAG: T9SS type A sorting domain-containing protein [Flavobacteriales bacterium]|nr:T9SS type A sorting domain-containing protein [Flavobacteriales bacterium]